MTVGPSGVIRAETDGVLAGWAAPDPLAPEETPEIALDIAGVGLRVVTCDAEPGATAAAGARGFAWQVPPALRAGGPLRIRAWHLGLGAELAGSPLDLPPGDGAAPRPAGLLARWPAGLAGVVPAASPAEVSEGVWAAAEATALSLRFELVTEDPGTAAAPPRRGVRLATEGRPGAVALHLPLSAAIPALPAPGAPALPMRVRAWLPEATGPGMQAQLEVWLSRREPAGFMPLRRLRRGRIFRRPAWVSFALDLLEAEAAEAPTLFLSLQAAESKGLAAFLPEPEPPPDAPERMEDARLEHAFAALRELVRLHGEAASTVHPLLPATAAPVFAAAADAGEHPPTTVVVPVCNGAETVRACIAALRSALTPDARILLVDDGSRALTAEMLRAEAAGEPRIALLRRDLNRGYTKSINEAVLLAETPWLVVLNSDTLVQPGWLARLHAAVRARPGSGMAGPLSNAATWQSIPAVKRPDGSWSTNDAIAPRHAARVQALLDAASERAYPEFPVLNGFCTLIAREVFDRVGPYDEDAFPMGYGEETDLCLRARRAGIRLTVADDCFVFHHKSVSFGSAGRQKLTRAGGLELTNKHLGVNIAALEAAMQACPPLARLRARLAGPVAELD